MENTREERNEIRQNVEIENEGNHKSEVILSFLSFQSIMRYIDVHKRLMMSICNRKICKLEKSVPLYIRRLHILSTSICLDDNHYCLGEIVNVDKFLLKQNHYKVKKSATDIKRTNQFGGTQWGSMENDVPELGDLVKSDTPMCYLLHDMKKKSQELRQCFLSSLENHLNTKENVNPMDAFERWVPSERMLWPRWMMYLFKEIRGFFSVEIKNVYRENTLVNYEDVQDDELSEMYPKAISLMKSRMEEMILHGDQRSCALRKLIYPLPFLPHFNQFSIFLSDKMEYSIRLPDGLSLRRAFKQFSTRILGGRRIISAGNVSFTGYGIFPLPVGLKLDCEQICVENLWEQHFLMTTYEKVVRRVDNIIVKMLPRQTSFFQSSIIQNCKTLQIYPFFPTEGTTGLRLLDNEVLHLGIKSSSVDCIQTIIRGWMENRKRRIGSKLFIAFDKKTCQDDIKNALNSNLLWGRYRGSTELEPLFCLPGNWISRFKMSLRNDKHHFSDDFLRDVKFDFYFRVEIVQSL